MRRQRSSAAGDGAWRAGGQVAPDVDGVERVEGGPEAAGFGDSSEPGDDELDGGPYDEEGPAAATFDDELDELDDGHEGEHEGEGEGDGPGRHAGRSAGDILRELRWPKASGERAPRPARPAPTREVVNGLSRQERTFGFAAALLDVLLSVELYLAFHDYAGHLARDIALRKQATTVLIAGLVGALILAAGAWFRRRALLGFAALIVGLELFTFGDIFGIAFLAFGGWVIVRHMRNQRQGRQAGAGSAPRAGGSLWRRKSSAAATAPARTPPPASKRYTPPKRAGAGATRRR